MHLLRREASRVAMGDHVAEFGQLLQVLDVIIGEGWEGALAEDHDVDEDVDVSVVNVLRIASLGKGGGDVPPANIRVAPHAWVEVCGLAKQCRWRA